MEDNNIFSFNDAAIIIKDAIVRSRYQAVTLVNKELLGLYYAVGRYVSENSRSGTWGQRAIKQLSELLQCELPGLRGFGEVSLKKMRLFYEAWWPVFERFTNRQLLTDDLGGREKEENRQLTTDEIQISINRGNAIDLGLLSLHISSFAVENFSYDECYVNEFL